jgi:hypothetical protein
VAITERRIGELPRLGKPRRNERPLGLKYCRIETRPRSGL